MSYSVDPNETTHHESSHWIYSLQKYIFNLKALTITIISCCSSGIMWPSTDNGFDSGFVAGPV